MSKAFTREDDDHPPEGPVAARPNPALPPGTTNWMTPEGARRLRQELLTLHRQWRDSLGADIWKRALAQRLADLEYILSTAEIAAPGEDPCAEVRFGTTVKVREHDGAERTYRIVGVDETDPDRGWVSWISPLARALLGAQRGQRVTFRFPSGAKELEIVEITTDPVRTPLNGSHAMPRPGLLPPRAAECGSL